MEWSEREWRAEQLRLADAELEAAKTEMDATDKLEEMAEDLLVHEESNTTTPMHKQADGKKVTAAQILMGRCWNYGNGRTL